MLGVFVTQSFSLVEFESMNKSGKTNFNFVDLYEMILNHLIRISPRSIS